MSETDLSEIQFRYFHPEVLNQYHRRPDLYEVHTGILDEAVSSTAADDTWWTLPLIRRQRADGTDLLVPNWAYFARMPAIEQRRWEEFEVLSPDLAPLEKDKRFVAAYQQEYEGEMVEWPITEGEPTNG